MRAARLAVVPLPGKVYQLVELLLPIFINLQSYRSIST